MAGVCTSVARVSEADNVVLCFCFFEHGFQHKIGVCSVVSREGSQGEPEN